MDQKIILNERAWVEKMLETHNIGKHPLKALVAVARYYLGEGYAKKDLHDMLEHFVLKCVPDVCMVRYQEMIETAVKCADKRKLIDAPYVGVTQKELDCIEALPTVMKRRLLFTLIFLAKCANCYNPDNNDWVNMNQSAIFDLANISIADKRKSLLINDLWSEGLLEYSKVIDNTNLRVKVVDHDGEDVLMIDDMRNVGNQYMVYSGADYTKCNICGLAIKRSGRRHMYCDECAYVVKLEQNATYRDGNSQDKNS